MPSEVWNAPGKSQPRRTDDISSRLVSSRARLAGLLIVTAVLSTSVLRCQVAPCIAGGEWELPFNHSDIPGPSGGWDSIQGVVQQPSPTIGIVPIYWRHAVVPCRPEPTRPSFNAAVRDTFGVRNDVAPNRINFSPRIGMRVDERFRAQVERDEEHCGGEEEPILPCHGLP